jgi:hypothetical protein
MLTLINEDDLVHATVTYQHARKEPHTLTACGREPVIPHRTGVAKGSGCHVCLPDFAHPMARVWATCRAFDDKANADVGEHTLR